MNKRVYISFLLVICAVLAVVALPEKSQAMSEIDKIEQQIKNLEQEQQNLKQQKIKNEKEIQRIAEQRTMVAAEIDEINAKIDAALTKMKEINANIDTKEADLANAKLQLEEAIQRIEGRDQLLRSRLHFIYTNGSVSYLEVLLESTSFSDFLDRFQALKSLIDQDKQILDSNIRDMEIIEEQKASIESIIAGLQEDYDNVAQVQKNLDAERVAHEVEIASLNAHEHELEVITEEQEEMLESKALEAKRLLDKKEKLEAFYNGGKIGYPLPKAYRVSSWFGRRKDPITGRLGASHNGIDFAAPRSTSVKAAESGRVLVAGWNGGYGNCVIIDHGNGLWTLYGHMLEGSLKVSVGDVVKKGDTVGKVGTTGRSTGYHLHFETRLNQSPVNPTEYLNL